MNQLSTPYLNPVRFYAVLADNPAYRSRPWEDYLQVLTIHAWEEHQLYCQKWQTSDTIRMQFESNFDPIQIDVIDYNGTVVPGFTFLANQKVENKYEPGMYVYEAEISLATLPPGHYQLKRTMGGGILVDYSEPFDVAVLHPETMLFEYSNSRYHGDVIFETGIVFSFRVEMVRGKLISGSQDTVYDDQILNPHLLSSKAIRSYPMVIGNEYGVPEWVDDLQNHIWTCNSVFIDGKSYAKGGESRAEVKVEDNYPLYGITRTVREGINRGSKISSTTADVNKKLMVIFNINTGVFGDVGENGATNIIQMLDSN